MYISHPKSEIVYTRRFDVFWSCIIIHDISKFSPVVMYIYLSERCLRLGTAASFRDFTMISGRKARSVYTNLRFLLDLYTRKAVFPGFSAYVYLLIRYTRCYVQYSLHTDQRIRFFAVDGSDSFV